MLTEKQIKEIKMFFILNNDDSKYFKVKLDLYDNQPDLFVDSYLFNIILSNKFLHFKSVNIHQYKSDCSAINEYLTDEDCFWKYLADNKFDVFDTSMDNFSNKVFDVGLSYHKLRKDFEFEKNFAKEFIRYLERCKLLKYEKIEKINYSSYLKRNDRDEFEYAVNFHLRNTIYNSTYILSLIFVENDYRNHVKRVTMEFDGKRVEQLTRTNGFTGFFSMFGSDYDGDVINAENNMSYCLITSQIVDLKLGGSQWIQDYLNRLEAYALTKRMCLQQFVYDRDIQEFDTLSINFNDDEELMNYLNLNKRHFTDLYGDEKKYVLLGAKKE